MTENTLPIKLEELRRQFTALQQLSREDPAQAGELLPGVLVGLQRSMDGLQDMFAELPGNTRTGTNPEAWSNGERSKPARPGSGLRFRAMAERGPILVRIVGTDMSCRWTNRAWLDFTGRSRKQLLGEGWLRAVHPEDRCRCDRICQEAFDPGRLYRVEYRLRRENGEYGWVLEIGTPRLTSRGKVGGYVGTAIEITERKQAESRLTLQYTVARVLSEARTLEDAAVPILQTLCEGLGWEVGELWSVESKARALHCAHVWASPGIDVSESSRSTVFPPGTGPPWQSGNPVWISDIAAVGSLAREPEVRHAELHGMFRLPVLVHGEVLAVLRVFSKRVRQRDDAVAEFMGAVGTQIGQFLERLHGQEKIRESEVRKAAILEASLDAVITIDHQGQVVEFNSAAQTIFGYRREDAVGCALLDLIVPPRMRAQALASFARYRATGESRLLGRRFDAYALKADGSEFPVEVAVAPIGTGSQPLLTIYVCDATARKNAEHEVRLHRERLRSLMADLLLAEEHERRRLAVDLHDGLSQTIALTQIKLSALRASMDGRLEKALDEIEELIEQTDRAARTISFELSPPVLHDLGLEPAVQWLVENIQARYGIEITLMDDGRPKPADERTRVILFRSIRELLINAAKHAGARRVHVRLEREEDRLNAAVEDDGVGMVPDLVAVKGSGLFSIQERLTHVGGSMRIESAPGRGTTIRLCAPLTNGSETKAG